MKYHNNESVDKKSQLGRSVMSYLGKFYERSKRSNVKYDRESVLTDSGRLFDWRSRGTDSDNTPAPRVSSNSEPKLRVSPLLSKQASLFSAEEGVDFTYDEDGYRVPVYKPISRTVHKWNKTMGSPILSSLAIGAPIALAYWSIDKFLNPDEEGAEGRRIEQAANKLIEEDIAKGNAIKDKKYYIDKAIADQKNNRNIGSAGIWLASSLLAHLWHARPKSKLIATEYPKTIHDKDYLEKKSSMLGPAEAMSYNTLQSAIAFNPNLAPTIKDSALRALSFNPAPMMTSTNIVSNAIYSGESARTGLPIGRIIASSAVDAASGYGLGKLFGVGSPKRAGLLAGIGSALYNALSYSSNNEVVR